MCLINVLVISGETNFSKKKKFFWVIVAVRNIDV